MAGHPIGLAPRENRNSFHVWNGLAVQLVRGPAVELEVARTCCDVDSCLLDRFAGVAAFELGQLGMMLANARRQSCQKPAALESGRRSPNRVECVPGGDHGSIDVFACPTRDGREFLPVAGVDDRDLTPPVRRRGAVSDNIHESARDFHSDSQIDWRERDAGQSWSLLYGTFTRAVCSPACISYTGYC
jgi:hypothetical protein